MPPYSELSDLPTPAAFALMTSAERVGWYVRVEQQHFLHHRRIEEATAAGEGDVPYDAETHTVGEWQPSREYVDPRDVAEQQRLDDWLTATRPHLPDWYQPGYRQRVETELSAIFDALSSEINAIIAQRRAQSGRGDPALKGAQQTLERCRWWLLKLWEILVLDRAHA